MHTFSVTTCIKKSQHLRWKWTRIYVSKKGPLGNHHWHKILSPDEPPYFYWNSLSTQISFVETPITIITGYTLLPNFSLQVFLHLHSTYRLTWFQGEGVPEINKRYSSFACFYQGEWYQKSKDTMGEWLDTMTQRSTGMPAAQMLWWNREYKNNYLNPGKTYQKESK